MKMLMKEKFLVTRAGKRVDEEEPTGVMKEGRGGVERSTSLPH